MTDLVKDNLDRLIAQSDVLRYVLRRLTNTDIRWGLYAGCHVYLVTGQREPTDIDILVHDSDLPNLRTLFPFARSKDAGNGVFLYIGENPEVEFAGMMDVRQGGAVFPFRLTDSAVNRLSTHRVENLSLNVVDPVDTVLLKAILQRDPTVNKHDIADIGALLRHTELDLEYLALRVRESHSRTRVQPIFEQLHVPLFP